MSKTPLTTSNSLASDIQKDLLIRGIIESDVLVSNTADFDIESVMNDFAVSASKIVFGSHKQLHWLLQDSKDLYSQELEIKSELFASISELNRAQLLAALQTIAKDRVQDEQSTRKPTLVSAYTSPQAKPPQGVAALTSASKRRPVGSNSSSKSLKSTHATESAVVLVVGVVKECSEQEFLQHNSLNYYRISKVKKAEGIRYLYLFGCNDSHHDDESKEVVEDLVGADEYDSDVQIIALPPNAMQIKEEFEAKKDKATKGKKASKGKKGKKTSEGEK